MNVTAGTHTYREIKGQSEAWRATLAAARRISQELAGHLRTDYSEMLFTGCGSTYYLSLTAATLWQTLCRIRARGLPASDVWLFPDSWLSNTSCLLIAISRSGETTETLQAVKTYRSRTHGDALAITCNPTSTLALDATSVLVAGDALEKSIVQTRSFTSMLLLVQYLAGLVGRRSDYLDELEQLPELGMSLMDRYEPMIRSIAGDSRFEQFVFLGSGPMYGLACEAMLKMKETSLSLSEAFHFLEFRHGPKSTVGANTLVVGLLGDTAFDQEVAVLKELQSLGASVLAIAESDDGLTVDYSVLLNSRLGELARGGLTLPLLQLLAFYRGMAKGLDPDVPTHLNAVVKL